MFSSFLHYIISNKILHKKEIYPSEMFFFAVSCVHMIDGNPAKNKDENAHRFALSAIKGELLERERKKER